MSDFLHTVKAFTHTYNKSSINKYPNNPNRKFISLIAYLYEGKKVIPRYIAVKIIAGLIVKPNAKYPPNS